MVLSHSPATDTGPGHVGRVWLRFPHWAKQDPARLLINSSCRLLSSQLLPSHEPKRVQLKPALLLPHFAFACHVCSMGGASQRACGQSPSCGLKEESGYLCEPWPRWDCRCGRLPLPQPSPHVFLTQGPSLTSPQIVIWGKERQRKGSDRGQMNHREICLRFKINVYHENHEGVWCTVASTLPPNPAREPMNQCTATPPITLVCLYTAAVLYTPLPRATPPPLHRNNVLPKGYQQPGAWSALILSPLHTGQRDSLL